MRRRKKIATAAMISATPIDAEIVAAVVGLCFGIRDRTQIVSTVAGTDPIQKPGNAPVDVAVLGVDRGASGFRHRGVEQIGSHRRERMHAEEEYQQRRHQRSATHAGETDDGPDDKTGEGIEPVHGFVSRSWWKIGRRGKRQAWSGRSSGEVKVAG